jgi:hypothetical protein
VGEEIMSFCVFIILAAVHTHTDANYHKSVEKFVSRGSLSGQILPHTRKSHVLKKELMEKETKGL